MDMSDILEKARTLFEDARNIEVIEHNVACITTPHLDHANDYIQIYLLAKEQEYTLTDDGWILYDMKHLIANDESLKLIERKLKRFGIEKNQNEITVKTDLANLTSTKENFVQAILAINEMMNCVK